MPKSRLGLTLMELILAIILLSLTMAVVLNIYLFVANQVIPSIKLRNAHLAIDYALENLRLRCQSAVDVDNGSLFPSGATGRKAEFQFQGERDPYNITSDDLSDNVTYRYFIDDTGALVLTTNNAQKEVLVGDQLKPTIEFRHDENTEPNFLTVTISADLGTQSFSKNEGLWLWFADAVK